MAYKAKGSPANNRYKMAGHVAPISRDFSGNQPLKSGVVQFICSDDAWKFLRFEPEAFVVRLLGATGEDENFWQVIL